MVGESGAPPAVESLRAIEQTIERLLFNSNKLHAEGKQTQRAICQRAEDGRRGRAEFFSFSRETRSCRSCSQPYSTYSLSRGTTVTATDKPECITSSNFRTDCSASTVRNERNETSTSGVSTDRNRASEATSTQTTSTNLLEEPPGCRQKTQTCETEVRTETVVKKAEEPMSPDPLATPVSNKKNSATQTSLSQTPDKEAPMKQRTSHYESTTSEYTTSSRTGRGDTTKDPKENVIAENGDQERGKPMQCDQSNDKRSPFDSDEYKKHTELLKKQLEKEREKQEADERRRIQRELQEESMLLVNRVQQKIDEVAKKERDRLNEAWKEKERKQMEDLDKEALDKEEIIKQLEKEKLAKEKALKQKIEDKKAEDWHRIKKKLEDERKQLLQEVEQHLNKVEADRLAEARNFIIREKEQQERELIKRIIEQHDPGNTTPRRVPSDVFASNREKRKSSSLTKRQLDKSTCDNSTPTRPTKKTSNSTRKRVSREKRSNTLVEHTPSKGPTKSRSTASIKKTTSKSEIVHKQKCTVSVSSADGKTEELPGKLTVERVPSSNFLTCRFVVKDKHGVGVELEAEIHGTVTKNIRINGKAVG